MFTVTGVVVYVITTVWKLLSTLLLGGINLRIKNIIFYYEILRLKFCDYDVIGSGVCWELPILLSRCVYV